MGDEPRMPAVPVRYATFEEIPNEAEYKRICALSGKAKEKWQDAGALAPNRA